ncbi:MAG TPA: hypothetical protein VNA25_18895 [Phycisphaerae bacterium]|nr:hypothetical protein [Phycisphaerae bacterium]
MFLNKHVVKKNGKRHTYWELSESVRTSKEPRHRTIAYLGELEVIDQGGWARLASKLDDKPLPIVQPTLFEQKPDPDPVPETVTVYTKGIEVGATWDFGDVWLALVLWTTLRTGWASCSASSTTCCFTT